MKQFEIWWADLPNPADTRPVLLLSRNGACDYLNKVIVAEITTIRRIAVEVPLGRPEGLPAKCVANCDNLRVVGRNVLTRKAGALAAGRRLEVKRAVGAALGWRELTDLD